MKKVQEKVYVSPLVRIVDIKAQAMLCQSKQTFSVENGGQLEEGTDDPWA